MIVPGFTPCQLSLSLLDDKERTLQKSCELFIEYAQAVLGDGFKPRVNLNPTPDAMLIFVLKVRLWPCQKYGARAA